MLQLRRHQGASSSVATYRGYRLGNEGDNGIEIDLIKTFKTDAATWKVQYMPAKWNSGNVGTGTGVRRSQRHGLCAGGTLLGQPAPPAYPGRAALPTTSS